MVAFERPREKEAQGTVKRKEVMPADDRRKVHLAGEIV